MQILYALLAMALLMLLAVNMNRSSAHIHNRMVINEVTTQLTGVGVDILEAIGRRAFDEATDLNKAPQPISYPLVTFATQLTPAANFGGCLDFLLCEDIDDFHGMEVTRDAGGLPYTVNITVRYVQELNPDQPAGGQTFAKEVLLDISSPHLLLGGTPLIVRVARVFTYDRITSL